MPDTCEVWFYSDKLDHVLERTFPDLVVGLAVARETLMAGPSGVFNALVFDRGRLVANLYRTCGGILVDIGPEPWALSRREADRVEVVGGKVRGLPAYVRGGL